MISLDTSRILRLLGFRLWIGQLGLELLMLDEDLQNKVLKLRPQRRCRLALLIHHLEHVIQRVLRRIVLPCVLLENKLVHGSSNILQDLPWELINFALLVQFVDDEAVRLSRE